MTRLNRRAFLKQSSLAAVGGAAALGLTSCSQPDSSSTSDGQSLSGKVYKWDMVTTWPPDFPVLGTSAVKLAETVAKMSSGRLKITVYGAGKLVPAMESFDAVSSGQAQMGHGAAYYWAGKSKAAQFFTAVPFGMTAQQMNAWIYHGGGHDLWREVYEPFGLLPFPVGNTGVQMGGWFNREINSLNDLRGLKMRLPGIGGDVLSKAGGIVTLSPGSEIYTNLERGVIDATEWVGPYHDYLMGFHKIAKFYYYPGWHEPGSVLEAIVNKAAYDELPEDLQMILTAACAQANVEMLADFEAKNHEYLQKMIKEHNVQLKRFPDEVLNQLKVLSDEVLEAMAVEDPVCRKVYDAFKAFQQQVGGWSAISEQAYLNLNH